MAWPVIAHTNTSSTSSGINTSGANLLVAIVTAFTVNGMVAPTDSETNTWIPLTPHTSLNCSLGIYYCINPTTDTNHTFTSNGSFGSISITAFYNSDGVAFDVQNGSDNSGISTTKQPGSLTPNVKDSLIITGCNGGSAETFTSIDSGFTIIEQNADPSRFSTGLAYLIETAIAAQNPTWTKDNGQGTAVIASFHPKTVTYIIDPDDGAGTDYTSIGAAADALAQDLVSNDIILVLECRSSAGTEDNTGLGGNPYWGAFNTYVTDSTHYIVVQSSGANKHTGTFSTSKYRFNLTGFGAHAGPLFASYTKVRGVQWINSASTRSVLNWGGSVGVEISDCIVKISANNCQASNPSDGSGNIFNNLFLVDSGLDSTDVNVIYNDGSATTIVENNTFIHLSSGNRSLRRDNGSLLARNNLFYQPSNFNPFQGTFAAGTDNNTANIAASDPGTGSNNHVSQTFTFTDFAGGDYSLASSDTGAIGQGTTLGTTTSGFTDDIVGNARPGSGAIDCGCFQFVAPAVGGYWLF